MTLVKNQAVWNHIRILFLGSAVLFLINNFFGFDNALTQGILPRWQLLIHLHAGSIGWITLSLIGIGLWMFTGERDVPDSYVSFVRALVWVAIIGFGGYIVAFGLGFKFGWFFLLPIFGSVAMLTIWVAAIFITAQLGKQPVVTTAHILIAGGLLVAAVGALMGVLLGMEHALNSQFLPIEGDRVGLHAGMMDTYLMIVASGVVEWIIQKDPTQRYRWHGLAQGIAWTISALVVPVAFLTNTLNILLPVFALLLLVGLIIYMVRMGWRVVGVGPMGQGARPWIFFGGLWLVVYALLFIYAAVAFGAAPESIPAWFFATFAHVGFVGTMTNLLLGVYSQRTQGTKNVLSWGEPVGMWTINLGMLVFFGLKIAMDIRLGAIVMGVGVVLAVVTMILRLAASGREAAAMS